ncbi:MAG: ATP synthase subunit F [Tissierellia bacterium]|nr:ATP synthase subunit F [Tissierellia bacterium]
MKSYLISDNKDTFIGLRLAGIQGVLAKTPEEMKEYFSKAAEDKNIGIIIVTEKILEEIGEEAMKLKKSGSSKLVVTIPDRWGLRDKDFIMKYIKESIGLKV